jgi:hypothetical protein
MPDARSLTSPLALIAAVFVASVTFAGRHAARRRDSEG